MNRALVICGAVIATVIAGLASVNAQTTGAQPAAAPVAEGTANKTPPFKKEELESILAPIALYPDALLAQIFMAATYPLEVVEAARWQKEHPDVKGDAVAGAVQSQTWDPSVKSLVAFPSVLTMMNEKIDWTQKLGDAFLAQQKEVMQSVQVLRNKAKETGNLKSTKEVTVKEEPAPAGSPAPQTIIIESPDPEVVYVPSYNPTVVYGAWSYPYYPPYYYYPPGYAAGAAFWSFTAGVIVGGAIWGNCNWGGNDVDIDINRQNNFNKNEINRGDRNNVNSNNRGNNNRAGNNSGNKQSWSHNADHRKGVGYKDSATQQKFNRGGNQASTQAREQYRGRAEQGRQQMSREGTGNQRDMAGNSIGSSDRGGGTRDLGGASNRDVGGAATRDLGGGGTRDMGGASTRDLGGGSSSRDLGGSNRSSSRSSSAFGGGSGSSARASSSRGGMSRGGGGMSRGGGGGRRR
jgi:uncharacterized membrane protein YgcG